MNALEINANEDTFKKTTSVVCDDICSKSSCLTGLNTISSFTDQLKIIPSPAPKNEQSEISESSHNTSIMEKDSLVPLSNPNLKNLKYIESEIPIYANLYKIELERNYTLYEYAVNFIYDKDDKYTLSTPFKQRIINTASSKVAQKYKNFIFIGSALFSEKKVEEVTQIPAEYHSVNYLIDIQPTSKTIEMCKDSKVMMNQYNEGKNEIKTIFEIIIKEILRHNPSLIKDANSYFDKSNEKELQAQEEYNDINVVNGYDTKVMILDSGIYLNVDKKTKISSKFNCLQLIQTFTNDFDNPSKDEIRQINDWFENKTVETFFQNHRRLYVSQVNFDRTPSNTTKKCEKGTLSFLKYYSEFCGQKLNPKSPLLYVRKKKNGKDGFFYPPELCVMIGLTDEMLADRSLTKDITRLTKLNPTDKMDFISNIVKYMNDKNCIIYNKMVNGEKKEVKLKSAFETKEIYGLNIMEAKDVDKFTGRIMSLPDLNGENGKIKNLGRTFKVFNAKPISSLCLFHFKNEKDARYLKQIMNKAKEEYGIILERNDFKHVNSDNFDEWSNLIDKCIKTKKYNMVTFLLNDYIDKNGLYTKLKFYTQEQKGIVTQCIKAKSLKKNALSVVSNILIQMNTKIGGISCVADFQEEIKKQNLMVVGVDSSGYEEGGKLFQNISFCASLDEYFTNYVNKKTTVTIEDYDNTNLPIANFMETALAEYFKIHKKFPGGVIIYRQGISHGQKNYLKSEIEQLQKIFNGESEQKSYKDIKIKYYYVLVNKKPTLKFFEESTYNKKNRNNDKGIYDNPDSGLLICDKLISSDKFEFYIQPQKVSQGTATPTCFQVEYGNMNTPEILPKLTFDLCFLYSNWRGPVRVPAPLKYAEKLAKSKAGVNEAIKTTLSYI
jgi:aubergine-like protein